MSGGGPAVAKQSSLLSTMAILLANYDANRDYLSNFEPFVVDRLKHWPAGEDARPLRIREELAQAYHLPPMPINTVTVLRDRAHDHGYLVQDHYRKYYPNPEELAKVPSLRQERSVFLDHFDYLAESICLHAATVHDLDWTPVDAEGALESFVEEFSIELAMAKREGSVDGDPALSRNEALAVVHGFARRALEEDDRAIDYLEEVVQASMLANVIYLQNLASWKPSLDRLIVFLDTTVVLRVLELTDGEVAAAAREMIELLAEFDVPVQIYDHTLMETIGVLKDVEQKLLEAKLGRIKLDQLANQGQEVLSHALRQGWEPGDVEVVIADLRDRLSREGIAVSPTPKPDPRLPLRQSRIAEILTQYGFTPSQIVADAQSLTAIHVMREGRPYTELGRARAIFVTSNDNLVRASRLWFAEQGKGSLVSQCTTETSMTTQLWLRRPEGRPDVARKFLVAESFAALNPRPEVWSRYLDRIAERRERDEITEEQVKKLVFSTEAKEILVEVAHGEPELVDDAAVGEVLARSEGRLSPVFARELESTQADVETLRAENKAMRDEITERDERLKEQAAELGSQNRELAKLQNTLERLAGSEERRARRETAAARRLLLARETVASALALLLVAAAVGVWFGAEIDSAVLRAGIGFAGICLAVAAVALGFGKSGAWAVKAVILVGAVPALFFGLVGLAQKDHAAQPPAVHSQAPQGHAQAGPGAGNGRE